MKNTQRKTNTPNAIYQLSVLILALITSQSLWGWNGLNENTLWTTPEGQDVQFRTSRKMEEYLLNAKVIGVDDIPVGVTKPLKLLLEKDGIQIHAIFRTVEVMKHRWESPKGRIITNFHDNCRYEYAAYKLSRLLGLNNVPPVVQRDFKREDFSSRKLFNKLGKKQGTLQVWIEDAMTEKDRREKNMIPPDPKMWHQQIQLMYLFDNLIYNLDRNQGNILIGPDWRIWFIDSTRAFRTHGHLEKPHLIRKCDRNLFEKLQRISEKDLEAELGNCLRGNEIRTLYERKEAVVQLLQDLIDERGEDLVLVD